MAAKGHKVYVIRHKIKGSKLRNLPANLRIYDVDPQLELVGGLPSIMYQNILFLRNATRLGLRIIKDKKVDIIHANNYTPIFVGTLLSKLTSRPLVVTIHHVASTNGLSYWKKWMDQFKTSTFASPWIGYVGEILTIQLPNCVIHTVSDVSRDDILRLRKTAKVSVIPNGLNLEMYAAEDSKIQYSDEIVFIGRAVNYKNLDTVLRAMKIVTRTYPDAKLVVIGDGPMKSLWQHLAVEYGIRKNVIFVGYISQAEKIDWLKRARALVLPSTLEGFGMVILEAWSLKKPVVVARLPPLSGLVDDEKTGFHAAPFDPEEWAEKISLLLRNEYMARKMGVAGYTNLLSNYTIEKTADRVENLYKEVLVD